MAIVSHRFTLFATAMVTALALSACQQKTEEVEPAPTKEEVVSPVTVPEVDTTDEVVEDAVEDEQVEIEMTDIFKDYSKSITSMYAEMMIGMGYNDPDTAFAKSMLGHHRGAIDMTQIQIKNATDTEMLKLAQDITASQQVEIDIIRKWLASHPDTAKPKPTTEVMQQAYTDDVEDMREGMMAGFADPAPDLAFARGMHAHHVGAVDMALIQLKYGADEEMRELALQIINRQQLEIQLIESWIAAQGAALNNDDIDNDAITDDENSIDGDLTEDAADK